MPKKILNEFEKEKQIHPLKFNYGKISETTQTVRDRILQATGWSYNTFYRKIKTGAHLTEKEALAVSNVLNIPVSKIDEFQNGFKSK